MQLHPLYEEQQQWLAQFKKPQTQQNDPKETNYFEQLKTLGFDDEKINRKLFKKFHGSIDRSVQALTEKQNNRKPKQEINVIELVSDTRILYLDCNNMKYANGNWKEFQGKDEVQTKKMMEIILIWLKHPNQQLEEIHQIWDVYKVKKLENLKQTLASIELFNDLINFQQTYNKATFQIFYNEKLVSFSVQSSHPKIADDLIVDLCEAEKLNSPSTTVVTSDRGLKERLMNLNVNKFIGNGTWWKLDQNLMIEK